MKKIILFIILGCLSIYGFPINPIDPPAKPADIVKTTANQSPVTTEECNDLVSLVNVTVIVTFTDCPNYDCGYPDGCILRICIYDHLYNLITCQPFDLETCEYTFEGVRAEETYNLYSRLVAQTPPGCSSVFNNSFILSSNPVPSGGGTVNISTTFCP